MRIFGGNDNFENMFCASLRDFFFSFLFWWKGYGFSFRKGIWESFREGVCSLPIHCVGKVSGTHFFPLLNAFQLCSEALERLPPLGGGVFAWIQSLKKTSWKECPSPWYFVLILEWETPMCFQSMILFSLLCLIN